MPSSIPALPRRIIFMLALTAPAFCLHAETFYLDADSGDDTNSGLSPESAWKSLARVNAHTFQPGDSLLLRRGARLKGAFEPKGSGSERAPITVAAYGEGPLPAIDADGQSLDAVLVRNVEYWTLTQLEVTNKGPERQPWRTGVHIVADGLGPMRGIRISGLYVHDVNGDLRKSHEGCGIYFDTRGRRPAWFEGLIIENCRLLRTDRNGICQRKSGMGPRSTGVIIRNNLLEDIGGDAIKLWGSDKGLVEHNVVRGGRTRCSDYAAGIWPWDCDNTVIQFNEVSGYKGVKDGQAFDSDYRCTGTVFQYNYSHNNEGGFMLICTPGDSYCRDTVIRYNISCCDGINSARVFHFGGGAENTLIHNNLIYIGPDQDLPLILCTTWRRGNARDTYFYNNIFYVDGRVTFNLGESRNNTFADNIFYGQCADIPQADPVTTRPPLADPSPPTDGFESLVKFKLTEAPGFMTGRPIPDNGGRDFFGLRLPRDKPLTIGVHQLTNDF